MLLGNYKGMSNGNPEVSLIIPTFNKASRLKLVLESLKKLEYKEDLEVVIVNDGSHDDTEALLNHYAGEVSKFSLKVISIKNFGRSYARNVGIQSSQGKLLIFSDDDLILDPKFVSFHIMMHKDRSRLVVHGQILSLPQLKFFKNPTSGELYNGEIAKKQLMGKIITPEMIANDAIDTYLGNNSKMSKFEKDIMALYENTSVFDSYVRWIGFTGGNVSVQKSNLDSVGRFDINMGREWGCEDLELGYRLYRNGVSFEYCNQAKNYHLNHYRDSFTEIHEQSLSYFIEKYNAISIKLLKKYFHGELASLVDWKNEIDQNAE
jgi:glycosyltransferase involved in cell wall biosynthesis